MRLRGCWLVMVLVGSWLMACGGGEAGETVTAVPLANTPSATAEPDPSTNPRLAELETAVSLWQNSGVTHYRVQVRHSQPTWSLQILTLEVDAGVVIASSHDCFPANNCIRQTRLDPADFTIDNLFVQAHNVATSGLEITDMTFNPTYGYPNAIIYEDGTWVTEGFEVLE